MTDDLRALLSVLDGPVRPDGEFADALFAEIGVAVGPEELSIALDGPEHSAPVLRRRFATLDPDPRADGEDARRQSGAGPWDGAIAEPAPSTSNRSRRRLLAYAAAAVVVVVVVGAVLIRHDTPSRIKIAPAAGGVGACAGKAYVINRGGTVSVIKTAAGVAAAPISVGNLPGSVVITRDGKHVYVANKGDGTLSVIATATGVVSDPIQVGSDPSALAMTPDGRYAYVANSSDATVHMITTKNRLVSGPIPVGSTPSALAMTPDGRFLYVANSGDGTVLRIRTLTGLNGPGGSDANGTVSDPVSVGSTPSALAITPDGKFVYVANSGDGTVSVLKASTAEPIPDNPDNDTVVGAPIAVGSGPAAVAITPDGTRAYVANSGDGTVSVITTATGAVSATIPVGGNPSALAITPEGTRAYVANSGDGTVSVITTATGAVSATIPVGGNPSALAICPARSSHTR